MIRGLYTAASGMLAMQRRQEALANNLANINTPGFKQDEGVIRSFPEQLLSRIRDPESPDIQGLPMPPGQPALIGRIHTGAYMSEALPLFAQGDIEQTDNPLDVALTDNLPPIDPDEQPQVNGKPVQPRLFFTVARIGEPAALTGPVAPEEIRYTRNGNWAVNSQGYLVTPDGYYVLDDQRVPIRIKQEGVDPATGMTKLLDLKPRLYADGRLELVNPADDAVQEELTVGLHAVANPYQLVREGNNVFRLEGDSQVLANNDAEFGELFNGYYALRQGWLERSNVDPTRTMTDMLSVLRAYEANQRVITTLDATMDKAANEIGRVNG